MHQRSVIQLDHCFAEVKRENQIICLYPPKCKTDIRCKSFNHQNFDKHVSTCHKRAPSGNIKTMFLTMIAQEQWKKEKKNRDDTNKKICVIVDNDGDDDDDDDDE